MPILMLTQYFGEPIWDDLRQRKGNLIHLGPVNDYLFEVGAIPDRMGPGKPTVVLRIDLPGDKVVLV